MIDKVWKLLAISFATTERFSTGGTGPPVTGRSRFGPACQKGQQHERARADNHDYNRSATTYSPNDIATSFSNCLEVIITNVLLTSNFQIVI